MVPRILLAVLLILACAGLAVSQTCCPLGGCCPATAGPGDFGHGGPPQPFHGGPGPGPQPFHGGDQGFHGGGWDHGGPHWGGGWGGGWQQPFNPIPWIAPVIENYATAPRSILNPMTGQYAVMTPGYWRATPPGSSVPYIWTPTAIWPITGATAASGATQGPMIDRFRQRKHHPIKTIIGGLIHGEQAVIHKLVPTPGPQPTPAPPAPHKLSAVELVVVEAMVSAEVANPAVPVERPRPIRHFFRRIFVRR